MWSNCSPKTPALLAKPAKRGRMRTEHIQEEHLLLAGWPVKFSCYRIGQSYMAEIEVAGSGAKIAIAIASTQELAQRQVLDASAARLMRMHRIDPELTVGG